MMTLAYFTAMSALVAYAVNCYNLKGKKLSGNRQMDRVFMILKIKGRCLSVPALGLYTCI